VYENVNSGSETEEWTDYRQRGAFFNYFVFIYFCKLELEGWLV